ADSYRELLDNRWAKLQDSHAAPDGWYKHYETLKLGSIPSPDECSEAPLSQKLLADVPNQKSLLINNALGNFYISIPRWFKCMVVDSNDNSVCGQMYSKTGGGNVRTNHLINMHPKLKIAVREFRAYQYMVMGMGAAPEQDNKDDDDDTPSTPKMTKFEAVSDESAIGNMKAHFHLKFKYLKMPS
ncbi:hypothetical protein BGZ76_003054, partial [Entomortierella beljakovae]